jgi:hypothetical protein
MIPDEKLLKAINGYKRITIAGCGGCANDSLAYARNLPLKMRFDSHMGHNMPEPDIMRAEVERLKDVLSTAVRDIRTVVGMGMCAISDNENTDEFKWVKACRDADAIVAVTCVAGIVGIKTALGNKVKIIPGMKTTGVLFSYFKTSDNSGDQVYIDREKSSCISIFK